MYPSLSLKPSLLAYILPFITGVVLEASPYFPITIFPFVVKFIIADNWSSAHCTVPPLTLMYTLSAS